MNATALQQALPVLVAASAIEAEFTALRAHPPALHAAAQAALAHAAGPAVPPRLADAAARIADAMDMAAGAGPELPYHDRHHVAEAVLAMGWLTGVARRHGRVGAEAAALGITAMVGHDLLHDGSAPGGGVLEARAANAVASAISGAGLSAREHAIIRAVILGTDPCRIGENAGRAAGLLPAGPLGCEIDILIAMANEADVLASLTPELGWKLGEALAHEREAAGAAETPDPTTYVARLRFLRVYERQTEAAHALGIDRMILRQIIAFAPFGLTPEAGATALDSMARATARRRYLAALRRPDGTCPS